MPSRTLAARAKLARLRAGFALPQQAADAIGCSRPLVLAWENGDAKSIGGKYLQRAAKAYRVRPEWLTLDASDDGYPWNPESLSEPMALDVLPSQSVRPNPVTMLAVVDLLAFDEEQAGPYTVKGRTRRLLELWDRVSADGGELSEDSNRQFEAEVWARAQAKRGVQDGGQRRVKPRKSGAGGRRK